MTSYDAVNVAEAALAAEVIVAGGALWLRPASDEQIALNIIDALELAGFAIVEKSKLSNSG